MEENQNNWERITNLTNEYEPKLELANDVINKLNQRESTVKFKKILPIWIATALGLILCVAIVLICVFVPSKSSNPLPLPLPLPLPIYLEDDMLNMKDITDMENFIETNNINIHYVSIPNCYNQCAEIKEDDKIAYIEQKFLYISQNGFEQVELKIVVLQATYNFSESFAKLDESLMEYDIDISYIVSCNDSVQNLYAKFSIDSVDYYMKVNNVNNVEQSLEGIIGLLISD